MRLAAARDLKMRIMLDAAESEIYLSMLPRWKRFFVTLAWGLLTVNGLISR